MKNRVREDLRTLRDTISPSRRKEAAAAADKYLQQMLQSYSCILSFASLPKEINLWPLNTSLAKEGRLLLPRIEGNDLKIYQVNNLNKGLIKNSWGLLEPIPNINQELKHKTIDIVLVPGLGFDANNQRIGYGKGYYDRLLSKIPNGCFYGIGFKEQKVETPIASEKHDIALTEIILF